MLLRLVLPACFSISLLLSSSGFAAPEGCDVTGEQILSDLFVKPSEFHLKPEVIEKRSIEGQAASGGPLPTEEDFRKRYPYNAKRTYDKQTWLNYDQNMYAVKAYDPHQGRVTLSRNILNYQPLSELAKFYPESKIQIGKVLQVNGEKFQVLGIDQFHLSKTEKVVHLAKRVTLSVPLSEVETSLNSSVHLDDLKDYLLAIRQQAKRSGNVIPFADTEAHLVNSEQADVVYRLGAPTKSPFHQLNEELKLSQNHILEVTKPDNSFVRIPLKDYTFEMEQGAKSVEVYDPLTQKLVVNYQRLDKWGNSEKEFLNITPVKSNVYRFKIGKGPQAKEITVSAPMSPTVGQDAKDLVKIRSLIEKIPTPLKGFVEAIHFDPGASGAGLAAATSRSGTNGLERQVVFYQKNPVMLSVVSDILNRPHVGETFWHELGHHLQAKVATQIPNFNWTLWEDAMVKDRSWVTPYAMTLTSEDFPETLARYIRTDAGRLDPQSRNFFKHRFEILDRLFKTL